MHFRVFLSADQRHIKEFFHALAFTLDPAQKSPALERARDIMLQARIRNLRGLVSRGLRIFYSNEKIRNGIHNLPKDEGQKISAALRFCRSLYVLPT